MKENEIVVSRESARPPSWMRRVSWGAIFAGFLVTIVIQIMLTLLGAAIGLASVTPQSGQNLALGSGLWLVVSGLVSIWIGACVAGRLSNGPLRSDGLIHGIVTWSLSTLVTLMLLATAAGTLIGGTGSILGGAMATNPGQGASLQDEMKAMFPQAGGLLPPTGRESGQTPGSLTAIARQDPEVAAALARMEKAGGAAQSQDQQDQLINLLTSKHGLDQQQASQLISQWDQQFQQTKAQLTQAGQKAAHGISQAALWGFIALLCGLLVAAWGGWAGAASLPKFVPEAYATTTAYGTEGTR